MTTETDAASTAETQAPAPAPKVDAKPELKSKDTGVLNALREKAATAPPPTGKPVSNAPSADKEEPDADSSEADDPGDQRKLDSWIKKRISRAEEKGRKLGRSETLEEVRALRAPPAEPAKAEPPKASPATKKSLADYDYDVEAYTDYVAEQKAEQAFVKREAAQEKARQDKTAEEARNAFEKRKAEFEKRVGEGAWDEMVSTNVDVPQEVIDLLTGHAKDLDIAHYLVQHPDEIDKLRGKSKLEMARGLSTIETRLSGSSVEELPPRVTKTPPPPPSVHGSGKSVKSIEDMSTAERIATWKALKQSRQKSA